MRLHRNRWRPPSKHIESEIGPVDIVVNNTGVQHRSPLLDFADEEFRRILDTNLVSAFYVGREFARAMIGRGRGKIINICSVQSKLGRAGIAPYAASKGGLKMLTRGMCAEWAHLGLQINALAPGYFDTKLTEALVNDGEFPARLAMRTPQADGAPRGTRRRAAVPLLRGVKLRQWPDPLRGRRPDRRRLTARIDNHSPPDRKRAMSNLHPQVHLGPTRDSFLSRGIERGGGVLVPLADADAVVWTRGPDTFPDSLPERVRWVQLPSAGVEPWLSADIVDDTRIWTSAAGAYAQNVAEHAVLLLLAGVRALGPQVRATSWRKTEFDSQVGTLRGATVAIVGCGGIGRAIIPILTAFGARILAPNAVRMRMITRADPPQSHARPWRPFFNSRILRQDVARTCGPSARTPARRS